MKRHILILAVLALIPSAVFADTYTINVSPVGGPEGATAAGPVAVPEEAGAAAPALQPERRATATAPAPMVFNLRTGKTHF